MNDKETEAEKAGSRARAAGIDAAFNPYYSVHGIDAVAGLGPPIWLKCAKAWHRGWVAEQERMKAAKVKRA